MGWDAGRNLIGNTPKLQVQDVQGLVGAPIISADETDDYPANPSTTGVFAPDGTASGYFHSGTDVDWFAISVASGETVEIASSLALISFYDSTGALVSPAFFSITDSSRPGATYFGFTAPTSGTYYVAANANFNSLVGYTLTATFSNTVHPYDLSLAPSLSNGVTIAGTFASLHNDWYAVTLDVGETAVVRGGSTLARFYNTNGDQLSIASFTASEAGTYYVAVTGASDQSYSITPSIFFDDFGDVFPSGGETPGVIDPTGDHITGAIQDIEDDDVFEITLSEQQTVQITLTPTSGNLQLGVPLQLLGPGIFGSLFPGASATAASPATLMFTAPESAVYTIIINANNQTGNYTIDVAPIADDYSHDFSDPGAVINGAISGSLESIFDVDRFAFAGTAGQVIRLELLHTNYDGGFATVPSIVGPNGEEIAPSFYQAMAVT